MGLLGRQRSVSKFVSLLFARGRYYAPSELHSGLCHAFLVKIVSQCAQLGHIISSQCLDDAAFFTGTVVWLGKLILFCVTLESCFRLLN